MDVNNVVSTCNYMQKYVTYYKEIIRNTPVHANSSAYSYEWMLNKSHAIIMLLKCTTLCHQISIQLGVYAK